MAAGISRAEPPPRLMGLIGQFCVHENAWNLKKRALVAGEVSLKNAHVPSVRLFT